MGVLSGMTGFARTDGQAPGWCWTWEARSVNGKGLEARFRLPTGFERLEVKARELAKANPGPGSYEIRPLRFFGDNKLKSTELLSVAAE